MGMARATVVEAPEMEVDGAMEVVMAMATLAVAVAVWAQRATAPVAMRRIWRSQGAIQRRR